MLRRVYILREVLTPRAALRVLALAPSSKLTPAVIKKAYIAKTLVCHPDLNPNDPNATENFRTLSDAMRVALKAIEPAAAAAGRPPGGGAAAEDDEDGLGPAQSTLESLRQAILTYDAHRRAAAAGDAEDSAGRDSGSAMHAAFFSPSLEQLSAVCRREASAMRQVWAFCRDLPAVLSGSSTTALFDAVAFFHPHFVESTKTCVLRFARSLPIIVRRVVRNRPRYIRYKQTKATSGVGTGTRPREQRIEDMAMKPLVLMGAMLFDLPSGRRSDLPGGRGSVESEASDCISSSTSGISSPADVQITNELTCVVYPTDSIADITEKLSRWEASSFARLQLELALADACGLLSDMLGLDEAQHPLTVVPHLHLSAQDTERLLKIVQQLACDLCLHYDSRADQAVKDDDTLETEVSREETEASAEDDAAAAALPLSLLVAQCRRLATLTSHSVKGKVILTCDQLAKVIQADMDEAAASATRAEAAAADPLRFQVARHWSCATAEVIQFAVSVELTKDLHTLLLAVRRALKTVLHETNKSTRAMGDVLAIRDKTVKEEFIPLPAAPATSVAAEDRTYRYRAPIFVFPRIFGMPTASELTFWRLLHQHREYLAQHAAAMHPLNLFYQCLPYKPEDAARGAPLRSTPPGAVMAGWIGDAADGCDNVILTSTELEDPKKFVEWLEEVVEQASLNKECHAALERAGVAYMSRHPALPLANYLSFIKVFLQASAVRDILEARHRAASLRLAAGPEDVGLSIVVGTTCDVRDGGRLLIPWYMDPSLLLALLSEGPPQGYGELES